MLKSYNQIKLVLPSAKHCKQVMGYKEEFVLNNEESQLSGATILHKSSTYQEWYSFICDNMNEATVRQGFTTATTYLAMTISDEKLIGIIDIRHRLNTLSLSYWGNIGYSVRKSERRKGYATKMLRLALKEAKLIGLKRVMISCDKTNLASAKVIMRNGGVLENEVNKGQEVIQRYWIDLSSIE